MKFERRFVTPQVAENLLKRNSKNRAISQMTVDSYAKDMLNGNWIDNTGETIKLSKTNDILDGQHRLLAIIKSGVTLSMWFSIGLDDDIFEVLDTGKRRSGSDALSIIGAKYYSNLQSAIQVYKALKRGVARVKLTNIEIVKEYKSKPEIWESASKRCDKFYTKFDKLLSKRTMTALYVYISENYSNNTAESFLEQMVGIEVVDFQPFSKFRSMLIASKLSKIGRLETTKVTALFIKLFNLWISGKSKSRLNYDASKECYPRIKISSKNNLKTFS